ncbi:putative major facilitator superfamily, MFS transporter superfamily [Helianthus annuus]|nr:putative major facilitator superfamily, MFS transporter superfamily [Helianthus annuus]
MQLVGLIQRSQKRKEAMRGETLTLILINLAGIMERADESLLPGVYKEVGEELHADPTRLGSLTLFRSIVQASCFPLAAYLSARHNRAHIIAYGAFLWAAATFLVAFSSSFLQVAISRGLNGIGLAIVGPAIQSLVADSTSDENRGMAFGWLQLTSNLGSIIGGLLSLLIASTTFMGIPGWRVAFHLVGIISVIVGILVRLFADDPLYSQRLEPEIGQTLWSNVKDLMREAKVSWARFHGLRCRLHQCGWNSQASHKNTAFLIFLFVIGNSLGGLFGGRAGDVLSKRFPKSGRIVLSQISSGSAIPLGWLLLLALKDDPSTFVSHAIVLLIMGFFISWNAAATNNPIFAEIVPEKSRTSIYALDRSFESILSSFAPPIVGILAQHVYGYIPIEKGSESIATDRENATSLAKALYASIGFPMALCCFIYSFLYRTYPRDRERARMEALIEAEMDTLDSGTMDGKQRFRINDDIYDNDRTSMEMEYDDSVTFDESDEKMLLHRQLTFADMVV